VLRRALSKRPADRFPVIRAFSHAFSTAAFGQPADLTPAPFLVSTVSPPSVIIEQSEVQAPQTPGTPLAIRTPPDERAPQAAPPPVGYATVSVRRRRRIKPAYAVVAAAAVLLLLGVFLLFRWSPMPNPANTNTNNPVSAPVITPPVQPPPAPPAAGPEPSQVQPTLAKPEPPRTKPGKSAKPAGRGKAKRPTTLSPGPKAKRHLIKEL
jgi:hypothetical protein